MNNNKLIHAGVITRITALWAFSEAFLGGILHGFKIPFTGLVLSLIASICISVTAASTMQKGAILKATLTVIAIKFILSPQTPPMAYVAVCVQGLAGELFFIRRKAIRASSFLLSAFSLMYSAFQHLIILSFFFGTDFWKAIDIFLNGITKSFMSKSVNYSIWLVSLYLACYLIAGIVGGVLCSKIVNNILKGKKPKLVDELSKKIVERELPSKQPKKFKFKPSYVILLFLAVMLIASYMPVLSNSLLKTKVTSIIVRGVLIMLVWAFLVSPLVSLLMQKWVTNYQQKQESRLIPIFLLLPEIKQIIQISWQHKSNNNKIKQLYNFISNTIILIVYAK